MQPNTEELLDKISPEMIEKYSIQTFHENEISIHIPAYVNIDNPKIERNTKIVLEISNDIVSVTLWKEVHSMHVSVRSESQILCTLKNKESKTEK